jgi:DNA-binding response OmpR family regulator
LVQRTVLVVDDERYLRELIADVLEAEGYAVMRAGDGLEATKAIARQRPDLVIADILMPTLDGISLARKIRERKRPIPIILMSATRRERIGLDIPFIAKPFDIDTLIALAREQIDLTTASKSGQVAIAG